MEKNHNQNLKSFGEIEKDFTEFGFREEIIQRINYPEEQILKKDNFSVDKDKNETNT